MLFVAGDAGRRLLVVHGVALDRGAAAGRVPGRLDGDARGGLVDGGVGREVVPAPAGLRVVLDRGRDLGHLGLEAAGRAAGLGQPQGVGQTGHARRGGLGRVLLLTAAAAGLGHHHRGWLAALEQLFHRGRWLGLGLLLPVGL